MRFPAALPLRFIRGKAVHLRQAQARSIAGLVHHSLATEPVTPASGILSKPDGLSSVELHACMYDRALRHVQSADGHTGRPDKRISASHRCCTSNGCYQSGWSSCGALVLYLLALVCSCLTASSSDHMQYCQANSGIRTAIQIACLGHTLLSYEPASTCAWPLRGVFVSSRSTRDVKGTLPSLAVRNCMYMA